MRHRDYFYFRFLFDTQSVVTTMAEDDVKNLGTYAIIGFDGSAIHGLKCHPDGEHIIYPMGNKVCIQHWKSKRMHFLSGHTNSVATVAVSAKGKYIGSGQINHIGFKASVMLWDFQKKTMIASHELHKVRVEALTFTSDERFMVSIGGRDDGCVVVWDCVTGNACGTAQAGKLTTGDAYTVTPLSRRPNSFITGGDGNLRVWDISAANKSLHVADVCLGRLKRCVKCIAVSKDDSYGIAGTTTGDLLKFTIKYPADPKVLPLDCKPTLVGCYAKCGHWKKGAARPAVACYSLGVQSVLILDDDCLLVGAGDGTVDLLDEINWSGEFAKERLLQPNHPKFKALKSTKLDGSITSLQLFESSLQKPAQRLLLAGTKTSEIYAISLATFAPMLVVTCHRCAINDICFPKGMSGVFATAGAGDVRVWSVETCQELLRIVVPNFVCSTVLFTHDGKAIISGWNDGCIRAFTPLTGRLIYCILNTHNKGTSALSITSDGRTLISGGCEGQVRVWDIKPSVQSLRKVLKEHKSPVSAIQVCPSDTEAVSAGTDGSCIIWDLQSLSRRQVMYANTLFMCICYEPSGCQILTGGSDRRVSYWEVGSGNLARELEATKAGAINGLHVSTDGHLFVSGGNDQIVKLWKYQDGIYTHVGLGHSGAVTCCRFSPDTRYIVSSCAAGSIIVWKVPEQYLKKPAAKPAECGVPTGVQGTPEDLRLPLSPQVKAPVAVNKLPSAPSKVEKIEAMDTSRSSVISCCPCGGAAKPGGDGKSPSTVKSPVNVQSANKTKVCVPPGFLPTKTTSKASISSKGSGDRKR